MQNSASEIAKICESWWGHLADSSKVEQRAYVMKLLALLDWDFPIPFSPKAAAERLNALTYLLRADGLTTVAAYFLMPGALDAPSIIRDKGLDYCTTTRLLMEESTSPNIHYVFISDLNRSYFYDNHGSQLLLSADDPASFNQQLAVYLQHGRVSRGALEEIRREPRSAAACRLRDWCDRWTQALNECTSMSTAALDCLMDRLLFTRYVFQHDIFRRTRRSLQGRFIALCDGSAIHQERLRKESGGKLVRLFHDMWLDWRAAIYAPLPALDELLEGNELIPTLLHEFMLLSPTLFSMSTILERFNFGDPTEKLRIRMVPDRNEEREIYLSRYTLDTIDAARITVDIYDEGYRAIFHWLDALLQRYEQLNREFETQVCLETEGSDLDLFGWSDVNARRPQACSDRLRHACEQGFRVVCKSEHQQRLAKLLVHLYLIQLAASKYPAMEYLPPIHPIFSGEELNFVENTEGSGLYASADG
ncbi:MAG: hypothetical protein GX117_08100 [Candidatus Hydrogenedentes bacterium]|jgi:hypothetical protein|nr:hypothetical protein [Candidatus Hydrogenedentota bacterium]